MEDENMSICTRLHYAHQKDAARSENPKWKVVTTSPGTSIPASDTIPNQYWSEGDARRIAEALNKAIDRFAADNELKLLDKTVTDKDLAAFAKPLIRRRTRLLDPALMERAKDTVAKWLTASDNLYREEEGSIIEEINRLRCIIVKHVEDSRNLRILNVSGFWRIDPKPK